MKRQWNEHKREAGRIIKSTPAIQNIEVRTELGREIKDGFTKSPLITVDYGAVEKRIMASLANIKPRRTK